LANLNLGAEMADRNNPGQKLSALGVRLRRGETALAALTLSGDSAGGSGNRGSLVLTDRRLYHISGPGAQTQIKSAPLLDVGDAVMARRNRYIAFLLVAGYFLIIGVSYLIATAMAGAFQGIVLVPTLLLGGGFLVMWWYSGGDTVIRMEFGDTQLEGVTGRGQRRETFAFLEKLTEVKEKIA